MSKVFVLLVTIVACAVAAEPSAAPTFVASVGGQSAVVGADGHVRVRNVPAVDSVQVSSTGEIRPGPLTPYRMRIASDAGDIGVTGIFTLDNSEAVTGNRPLVPAPAIDWNADPSSGVPTRMSITSAPSSVRAGTTFSVSAAQLVAGGTQDISAAPGTTWLSSDPVRAPVGPDGTVHTAHRTTPARVIISALSQGRIANASIDIVADINPTVDDSDGDGMPDAWERLYGFDPHNPADADLDPDGDGVTNVQEYRLGTNPLRADTDGDGLADGVDPDPLVPESVPPVVAITQPASGESFAPGTTISLRATATDNVSVRRVVVRLGDVIVATLLAPASPLTVPVTLPHASGPVALSVTASDYAGNTTVAALSIGIADGPANAAPIITVVPDRTEPPGVLTTILSATVTDDGLPNPPARVVTRWTAGAGAPGAVVFADALAATTAVSVSAPGTYRFTVIADDGALTNSASVAIVFASSASPAPDDRIHLIDISHTTSPNGWFLSPIASADGRYALAMTYATNLTKDLLAPQNPHLLVWDRWRDSVQLVGELPNGELLADGGFSSDGRTAIAVVRQSDGSFRLDEIDVASGTRSTFTTLPEVTWMTAGKQFGLSGDGRWIAIMTSGSFTATDTNGSNDLYCIDRTTGAKTLVSANPAGVAVGAAASHAWYPRLSSDGRLVAFSAPRTIEGGTDRTPGIYIRDMTTGAIERVDVDGGGVGANATSSGTAASADGRYVAFSSGASNLGAGLTGLTHLYRRDRVLRTTSLIDVGPGATVANGSIADPVRISADGSRILYMSSATNLVSPAQSGSHWYLASLAGAGIATTRIAEPDVTANIREVTMSDDGSTALLTTVFSPPGAASRGVIAAVDLGHNASAGAIHAPADLAFAANNSADGASAATLSADGRYVAFASMATDLTADATNATMQVYVFDRHTGVMQLVSHALAGGGGNGASNGPAISADGHFIAFTSKATNLVTGDTNNVSDVFVADRVTGTIILGSANAAGQIGTAASDGASINADGRFLLFNSTAFNLVAGSNGQRNVYVKDLQTGAVTNVSRAIGVSETFGQMIGDSSACVTGSSLSADGRTAVFASRARKIPGVLGSGPVPSYVYVHHLDTATTEIVHNDNTGDNTPAISADGRFVAFVSMAALTANDHGTGADVYVRDLAAGTFDLVSALPSGDAVNSVSGNSIGSTNGSPEIGISADGRYVVFGSGSRLLDPAHPMAAGEIGVFLRDRVARTTTVLAYFPQPHLPYQYINDGPALSADGVFGTWIGTNPRPIVGSDFGTHVYAQPTGAPAPSPTTPAAPKPPTGGG